MLSRFAPALAAALMAGPALADQMTMGQSIESASLHEGALDMVAYYVPAPDGAFEVTATFAPRTAMMMSAAPARLVMVLADGDDVAFSMPGYPETRYRFTRAGDGVTVSARPTAPAQLAGF
jgi:hypothetical protein